MLSKLVSMTLRNCSEKVKGERKMGCCDEVTKGSRQARFLKAVTRAANAHKARVKAVVTKTFTFTVRDTW